jgi:hypothetical protein
MVSAGWIARAVVLLAFAVAGAPPALATPSTNFWAPSTHSIQGFKVMHLTYDTYFARQALYPIDVGLTMGVLPWNSFQAEVGFDLVYPTASPSGPLQVPVLLNAKAGAPEHAYFQGSPGWSAGIFAAGFEEDVTDYNILYAVTGKTFSTVGALSVGGYYGLNRDLFLSSDGREQRAGVLAGWMSPAWDVPLIDRIHLTWDVQSGKNVFGATGGGVYLYVTPTVDVLMGPVFFFDQPLQPGGSSWMWSVQVDVDVSLVGGGSR